MGVNTDAVLVLGVEIPEHEAYDIFGDYAGNTDEWIDHILGFEELEWEQRSEMRKHCPIAIEMHCSYSYPMYIFRVNDAMHKKPGDSHFNSRYRKQAYRGTVMDVDPKELVDVDPKDVDAFKAWLEGYGFGEYSIEPKWILCSMWGQ